MTAHRIGIIVLGAGLSRRMGQPKQLLPLGGQTVLGSTLLAAAASGLSVRAVIGEPRQELAALCDAAAVPWIYNEMAALGQAESVRLAVRTWRKEFDGLLFLAGDMPFIESALLVRLAKLLDFSQTIARPFYQGIPQNPVLFGSYWYDALEALTGDTGGRSLLKEKEVRRLDWPRFCFMDIDTPQAYEQAKEVYHAGTVDPRGR